MDTKPDEDICGFCGEPGADKMPHPVRWPGEKSAGTELVHAECEQEECKRAHALLNDDERRHFLRTFDIRSTTMRFGFLFVLIGLLIGLLIGTAICGFCFDYNLSVYFGKDIPWYGDCLAGLFAAPINVPAAVLGYVLECCDVKTPIFG